MPKGGFQSPLNIFSQDPICTFSHKKFIHKAKQMANFHSRSNSFPSNSHPVVEDVEDQLCRLTSSQATSTSASSICENLAALTNLHNSIINLIQMPSIQQSLSHEEYGNSINELVEGSLSLVDLCEFSRDIMCLTKESVQDLESSIRRNRGETSTADINAYVASRKMIIKRVNKCIKNLKSSNNSSSLLDIVKMLKEAEALGVSVLKSVLKAISEEKGRSNQKSWSLLSKFTHTNRVHSEVQKESDVEDFSLDIQKSRKSMDNSAMQKQLKQSEETIQEFEEGLESYFRSLVKTRATFLNVLSH